MVAKKPKPIPWPLCADCAKKRGGIPAPWPCTCVEQTCKDCGTTAWIGSYTDWSWPNGDRASWD